MFIIEDYELENPNWDNSSDTLDTLNSEFHLQATQALVAAAMSMSTEQPWQ